ncbi:hypothetical protein M3204_12045 [Mesobacillus subterraneus]|uniref:hypothetical protein n=1 Tax=Mesobacillus subterraneus TaxID=285983 RepID=UPI002041A4CC|nr:hypothetical protein [Mesobacillus subterraneus]MCM3665141.1 hypothetical protein [Mesobacillus subterraneus]MCM3684154.1 hypothetical protein [Mesobacillus subterraneus]
MEKGFFYVLILRAVHFFLVEVDFLLLGGISLPVGAVFLLIGKGISPVALTFDNFPITGEDNKYNTPHTLLQKIQICMRCNL